MGTWGNKLYEDDDAQDARDVYTNLLSKGLDGPEATDQFLKMFKDSLDDSDDGPIVWFVLADTQWKLGRLEERVKKEAIRLIDDGSSLERWKEGGPKEVASRQKVLDALKEQLLSKQPPRKVIKVQKPSKIATWEPGELIAYRLKSGRSIVLCLEDVHEGHHAYLSALEWIGDEVPAAEQLEKLRRQPLAFKPATGPGFWTTWPVIAIRKRDVPYDRMTRLETRIKTAPRAQWCGTGPDWSTLDETLKAFYGWE